MDIDELLEKWESAWNRGLSISPEELCVNCPELTSAVRERIAELIAFSRFQGTSRPKVPLSSPRGVIGEYVVETVLGGGGTSVVYRCLHQSDGHEVAIKVLNAERMSPAGLARFEREANILRRLDHPSVVRVLDVGLTDLGFGPQRYIAMELARGERLDHFVERRQVPIDQRAELIARIGEAVAYLHKQGVIHRDLKPTNVIVSEHGWPVIVDFGIAHLGPSEDGDVQATDTSMAAMGTLPYVSPEQLAGHHADVDARTDIYSLGVTAYQLVTNCLPIKTRGRSLFDIYQQIQLTEPPRADRVLVNVPRGIALVVAKAMAKHREDRYQTMEDFTRDLRRALRSERTVARTPHPLHLTKRWTERNPRTTAVFGVVTIVLAAATIMSVYFARSAAIARNNAEKSLRQAISQTELARERNEQLRRTAYDLQLARNWQMVPTRPEFVIQSLCNDQACPPEYRSTVWGMALNYAHRVRHTVRHERPYTHIENDAFSDWVYLVDDQGHIKVWQLVHRAIVTEFDAGESDSAICSISRNLRHAEIAVAHVSGHVYFYDERTGKRLAKRIDVGESIADSRYADDGTYSCVCSDGSVRRFAGEGMLESGRFERRHASPVSCTAYSPLGHVVAIMHAGGRLVIHNLQSDRFEDIECPAAAAMVILQNDAQIFMIHGLTVHHMLLDRQENPHLVVVNREVLCDVAAGGNRKLAYAYKNRVSIVHHSRQPYDTSISLEADRPVRAVSLCQAARFLTVLHSDGTITIWDTECDPFQQRSIESCHPLFLLPLRNSRHILAGGKGGIVSLVATGEMNVERQWKGHRFPITLMAVNSAESLVATHPREGNVRVWEIRTGKAKGQFRRPLGNLTSIAFLEGDQAMLLATDKGQLFKGTFTQEQAESLRPFADAQCVLLSREGQEAMVAISDGRIQHWQIEPRILLREFESHLSGAHLLALSHDGKRMASAHGNTILVWSRDQPSSVVRCETPHSVCRGIEFSPDGQTLLTLGSEGILAFWDPVIGMQQLVFDDGSRSITTTAISGDGRSLITATTEGTVRWWNTSCDEDSP